MGGKAGNVQLNVESGASMLEEVATHPSRGQVTCYLGKKAVPLP